MTKAYYGPEGNTSTQYRLSPAPQVSISTEPYYSGDIIVGYTHNVSIRGYATGYRKTNNTDLTNSSVSGFGLVADNIAIIQKILSRNGSVLSIREEDNTETIKCKGGTLRSLSFNESPNNWMGYAEYSATIEFNEVELINGTSLDAINCSDSYLDPQSKSNSVVDIDKYKIKTFTDNWSINIDENIYNRVINTDYQNMDMENSSMTVSYTVSATGKNYYVDDKLIAAWEQAKNFAQDRLYRKVVSMLSSTLGLTAETACSASSSLSGIGSSSDGALKNLNGVYKVYNETLSCNTSESEGSFSVTYNAIIKKNNITDTNYPASKHTFTKTINVQNDTTKITTIDIQGTIEGLIEGGIVRAAGSGFSLPQNGAILIGTSVATKHSQALIALNKIIDGSDLKSTIKSKLGISIASLGLTDATSQCSNNASLSPSSFSLTHNYQEGTINYNVQYASNTVCGELSSAATINISVENKTPVIAEIILPRTGVLIIQDIGTKTAKKVNISIEGRGSQRECCQTDQTLATRIQNAGFSMPQGITLPDMSDFILTQQQRTDNLMDGSYSISLGYICSKGCDL
jgi:hypothetical protein